MSAVQHNPLPSLRRGTASIRVRASVSDSRRLISHLQPSRSLLLSLLSVTHACGRSRRRKALMALLLPASLVPSSPLFLCGPQKWRGGRNWRWHQGRKEGRREEEPRGGNESRADAQTDRQTTETNIEAGHTHTLTLASTPIPHVYVSDDLHHHPSSSQFSVSLHTRMAKVR